MNDGSGNRWRVMMIIDGRRDSRRSNTYTLTWGKSTLQSDPRLRLLLDRCLPNGTIYLEPKDWYTRGHDLEGGGRDRKGFWRPRVSSGTYVWHPPPAAADVSLEELCKARMKRKELFHISVIAKLFCPRWLRQLNKVADCHFLIPICHLLFWGPNNFEKMIIAFVFPFFPYIPWQLKGTPQVLSMDRELCKVFKKEGMDTRDILFKILLV